MSGRATRDPSGEESHDRHGQDRQRQGVLSRGHGPRRERRGRFRRHRGHFVEQVREVVVHGRRHRGGRGVAQRPAGEDVFDVLRHRLAVRVPRGGILGQRARDHRIDRRRDPGHQGRGRRRLTPRHLADDVGQAGAGEGVPAGEEGVADGAQREEVAARVERTPMRLLGRHVERRPEELARGRELAASTFAIPKSMILGAPEGGS